MITTYGFKDKVENYNLIIGNGIIESLNEEEQMNGMPIKSNLTGTINSSLKVDTKTGWIEEGTINELILQNNQVKDNPKLPGGIKQTISISTEMTYSSK